MSIGTLKAAPSEAPRSTTRIARTTMSEVMTTTPYTIDLAAAPADAYDAMREHNVRHLPVLEDGRLVGVLSQRDLFREEVIRGGRDGFPSVAAAMTRAMFVVAPGDRVADVARTMAERRYGCAIVVDRNRVVGIFTAIDALNFLTDLLNA